MQRLNLGYPDPSGRRIGALAKRPQQKQLFQEMSEERWQGKLFKNRRDDDKLSKGCFAWLKEWRTCPSYTIAGVQELYQQLLPTKLYYHKKTHTNPNQDVLCMRMCTKNPESVSHILWHK